MSELCSFTCKAPGAFKENGEKFAKLLPATGGSEDGRGAAGALQVEHVAQALAIEIVAAGGAGGDGAQASGDEGVMGNPLGEAFADEGIADAGGMLGLPGVAQLVGEGAQQKRSRQPALDVDGADAVRAHEIAQDVVAAGDDGAGADLRLLVGTANFAHLEPSDHLDARTLAQGADDDACEGGERLVINGLDRAIAQHHLAGAEGAAVLPVVQRGCAGGDGRAAEVAAGAALDTLVAEAADGGRRQQFVEGVPRADDMAAARGAARRGTLARGAKGRIAVRMSAGASEGTVVQR